MAIDMSTVKSITHNNKDVIKIEDSNGNVMWQKYVEEYFCNPSSGSTLYTFDPDTLTFDSTGAFNSYFAPNSIWSDGTNVYTNTDIVDFENKTTISKTWQKSVEGVISTLSPLSGNYVWNIGEDVYYTPSPSDYTYWLNKTTGIWESIGNIQYNSVGLLGNKVIHVGNDVYFVNNGSSTDIYKVVQGANPKSVFMETPYWSVVGKYVSAWNFWSDGTNYYYDEGNFSTGVSGGKHYKVDFTLKTIENTPFTSSTTTNVVAGSYIYKINNTIYCFTNTSAAVAYKLSNNEWVVANDFTNLPAYVKDGIFNKKGQCSLSLTQRPRRA